MKKQCLMLLLPLLVNVWLLGGCSSVNTTTEQASAPPLPSPGAPVSPAASSPPPPKVVPSKTLPSPPPPPILPVQSTPVEEKPFIHRVRWQGETLNRISLWYTGSAQNWPAIAKENPSLDPRNIAIGDLIIIPKDLLTRTKPMTADSFTPRVDEEIQQLNQTVQKAPVLQAVELFGPIDSVGLSSSSEELEGNLPLESLD